MPLLLFDVDGVLIRTDMWSHEYSRRAGLDPAIMKPFFSGVFRECLMGQSDLRDVIVPFLQEWEWEGSVDEYLKEWFDYENQPDVVLIEKIQGLRKKGVQCYIATNQEKYRLEYLRKTMHFEDLFDGIFCSAEMGVKKPEKEFYQKIIDTLRVDPSHITYYDDAIENIESAKGVGILGIHYRSMDDFRS